MIAAVSAKLRPWMNELRKLWIEGPAGRLECALRMACPSRAAAVLAHPHPLHGGTLHNPVIFHADRELHRSGWTTLRFNFRGVGSSEGEHDDGRGEVEDLASAVSWLRGVTATNEIVAVGYSFGSWCAIRHAIRDPGLAGVVAIGLPARVYDIGLLASLRQPIVVVQGEADEFGSPGEIEPVLRRAGGQGSLMVVPGASHMFPRLAAEVATLVAEAGETLLRTARSGSR
jgi:hypothetical protein